MLGINLSDGELTLKLGLAIDPLGADWIAFEIQPVLFPVKNIVGRKMNDGRALIGSRCRDQACAIAIDSEGLIGFRFSLVDSSVGRGVDDQVRTKVCDSFLNRGWTQKI